MDSADFGPAKIDPILGRAKLIQSGELELTAYHEAGHAAMALRWGGEIKSVELYARAFCRSRLRTLPWDREMQIAQTSLAGSMAECLYRGFNYNDYIDEEALLVHLENVRDCGAQFGTDNDDEAVINLILESFPAISDQDFLDKYDSYARSTFLALKEPRIWEQVEKIAAKLIEVGEIYGEDVWTVAYS